MLTSTPALERCKRSSDRPARPVRPAGRDTALEAAIEQRAIDILFQPQIEPASGRVVGAEALARWEGSNSPEDLFQRATDAGLQERLSRCVQMKALEMAARWTGPLQDIALSINLLPDDLGRPGYEHWLIERLVSLDMDPRRLTVEIVENALITDPAAVAGRLTCLREAGIAIAVDDFGTGYCSLAYLAALPLDFIKIDRGLIAEIVGDERHRIVVKAMVDLARALDLQVIVEGVECAAQLAILAQWGCDYYQGFLGAGPLTEDELRRFVAASRIQAA